MGSNTTASAVRTYVESTTQLGGADRRKDLHQRLAAINAGNARYFNVAAAMLALAFAVALVVVYSHGGDKDVMKGVVAGFGTSVTGMVWMMLRFWREKVRTEMLMALADLDPGVLREVALRFLDSLTGEKKQRRPRSLPGADVRSTGG